MLKSLSPKLVAVSASAVLASALIASSASALTVPQRPFHLPCEPQIALTSTGQVQGTCFSAGEFVALYSWGNNPWPTEYVTASANGTFTAPFPSDGDREPDIYPENVAIAAFDDAGNQVSNTLEVTIHPYRPVMF